MTEIQKNMLNHLEGGMELEKRLAVIEILLSLGVPLNSKSETLETPLHIAVRNNCFEVAEIFQRHEANIDEVDMDRRTPLHLCAQFSDLKMAELLLKHSEIQPKSDDKQFDNTKNLHAQEFQQAMLRLKGYRKQADEMRIKLVRILSKHVGRQSKVYELLRAQFQDDRSAFDAKDFFRCLSLLKRAHRVLSTKSPLTYWLTFWPTYLKYRKALRICHNEFSKPYLKEKSDRIDLHTRRWIKQAIKHVAEMAVIEDSDSPLHLAVGYCCTASIAKESKPQTAGAMLQQNNDKMPALRFKRRASTCSLKQTNLINKFTLSLGYRYADQYETDSRTSIYNLSDRRGRSRLFPYKTCFMRSFYNLSDDECLRSRLFEYVNNSKISFYHDSDDESDGSRLFQNETNPMSPFYDNTVDGHDRSKLFKRRGDLNCYVNRKDSEGYDALLKAVEFNRADIVQLLLANGADNCSVTSQGYSALHIAVTSTRHVAESSDPVSMLTNLLKTDDFNVNALSFRAETPLHLATGDCLCGLSKQESDEYHSRRKMHDTTVSLLLANKANVNQQDCEGLTPLMIASERGCAHIAQILLNFSFSRVDVDARDKYGETSLIKAARMHHVEIIKLLVNSGARIDQQEYRGFTALHAALHDQKIFATPFDLLESQPQDISSISSDAKRMASGRLKDNSDGERDGASDLKNSMIKILLQSESQFETVNFADNTPFDYLVESQIQFSMSRKEAKQRLDKMRNDNGVFKHVLCQLDSLWLHTGVRRKSPLFTLAALCIKIAESTNVQQEELPRLSNVRDNRERTLLHYAAILSGFDRLAERGLVFRVLLKAGCKIDAQDIYQRTPLHYMGISNSNLLLGTFEHIGMVQIESLEQQQLIFREILKMKDGDDKTAEELWRLRELNVEQERKRTSDYQKAVKAATLGTVRFNGDTVHICKSGAYDFATDISWSIWESGIADYAYRNTLTSCLTDEITNFIDRLASTIERKDPRFKCQPMLVGSAFEGTKIDSPDEFDFDFILTRFNDLVEVVPSPVAPEGFVHLKKKPTVLYEKASEFFNSEGILLTNEINCRFQIILSKVLRDPSFWEDEYLFESTESEDTVKQFVRWYDRHKNGRDQNDLTDQRISPAICSTIRLKQTRALEGRYLLRDISLDIVPCIHVDGWWPDKARSDISDTLKGVGCNLVFDQPQRKYPWVPFDDNYARISFAPAESQIIRDSSPTAKAAYMVCKHLIKDKPQMTYVLKTCFLYCIEALDRENERTIYSKTDYNSVTGHKLSRWVEKLTQCYLKFFLQDFCPCYLMPSFYLPVGDFLKSNHMLLHITDESDYEFLERKNLGYRCSFRECCIANFDLFRSVCTRNIDIPLPKPQPLCESFNCIKFISALQGEWNH